VFGGTGMDIRAIRSVSALAAAAGLLAACQHNPYATKVSDIAYVLPERAAAVTVSDPKLYRREALIEERKDETAYFRSLMSDVETGKVTFTPEIIRDLQTVTSLSAAVGLKFDPYAAMSYKQQKQQAAIGQQSAEIQQQTAAMQQQTAVVQQQVNLLTLRLQIDQLKNQIAAATAPGASGGSTTTGSTPTPTPTTSTPPPPPGPITPDAASQLTAAVTTLQAAMQTTFPGASTALVANGAGVSPIDSFRDREAYRDVLKSAINAASLDELHDLNGSALMRLSFEATVLPPEPLGTSSEEGEERFTRDYARSLAFLRMKVTEPNWDEDPALVARVYSAWLSHVNNAINVWRPDEKAYETDQGLLGLAVSGAMFDTVYYAYPLAKPAAAAPPDPPPAAAKSGGKLGVKRGGKPAVSAGVTPSPPTPPAAPACTGLSFQPAPAGCGQLVLAAPRMQELPGSPNTSTGIPGDGELLRRWIERPQGQAKAGTLPCGADGTFSAQAAQATVRLRDPSKNVSACDPADAVRAAAKLQFVTQNLTALEVQAKTLLMRGNLPAPAGMSGLLRTFSTVNSEAGTLLTDARSSTDARLTNAATVHTSVPPRFAEIVKAPNARVSIYEVAPRELVQQISTSARASEAIGLAAALSGQIPSAGLGVDGNIAYSRSVTGRADARERAPLVVSFAEAHGVAEPKASSVGPKVKAASPNTKPSFGWILGPPASLDAKSQAMVLEHRVKPYDLSVDLSVPGWWPYFDLETTSGWAPKWWNSPADILGGEDQARRMLRVQMSPNTADMAALTNLLSGEEAVRVPFIRLITPSAISPCAAVQVQITGDYIWRASTVTIGGRAYGSDKVNVLPDLGGVMVTTDGQPLPAVEDQSGSDGKVTVTALTPYGSASSRIDARNVKSDGSCKAPDADPKPANPKPDKTPTISDVDPLQLSACAAEPVFRIEGDKLTEVVSATLAGVDGKLSRASKADAKALTVTFPGKALRKSLAGLDTAPLTLKSSSGAFVRKDIALKVPDKCPT
jgi:hypothetical protein